MAVETPTKTRKPKAEKPPAKPVEKKEKAPKVEPKFSSADVMEAAKEFAASAKESLSEFAGTVKEYSATADADPKTYRDIITTIKFVQRRVDRLTLSFDELGQGLKERKPREVKPRPEGAAKRGRKPKAKVEEPEENDEDDVLDDDDEDTDLDD